MLRFARGAQSEFGQLIRQNQERRQGRKSEERRERNNANYNEKQCSTKEKKIMIRQSRLENKGGNPRKKKEGEKGKEEKRRGSKKNKRKQRS